MVDTCAPLNIMVDTCAPLNVMVDMCAPLDIMVVTRASVSISACRYSALLTFLTTHRLITIHRIIRR